MSNYFEELRKREKRSFIIHCISYIIILIVTIFIIIFNVWACIKLVNSDLPDWLKFLILVKS